MNASITPLSVLLVENSASDADLIVRELQKAEFDVTHERVADLEEMRAALSRQSWDLVISDFSLPGFGAVAALDALHQAGLDLPFIVVSGVIDDASAIELMRTGAHDYLMKGNLARLAAVVHREVAEARSRAERRRAEAAVRENEQRFRAIADSATDGIVATDASGLVVFFSRGAQVMFGYSEDEVVGWHVTVLVPEDDRAGQIEDMARDSTVETPTMIGRVREARGRKKDGTIFPIELAVSRGAVREQVLITAVVRDITPRKAIDDTLHFLAESSGPASPEEFFRLLARFLARVMNADFVCIDRLSGEGQTAETLAAFTDGRFEDNIVYGLKDTPCGQVVGKKVCVFPSGVGRLFPHDEALQKLNAEGYIGVTLWGAGAPIGLIAVITRRALATPRSPSPS